MNYMKKILIVATALGGGGAERVLSILAQYFNEHDYNVEVVSLVSDRCEYISGEKITNHFIGNSNSKWLKTIKRYTRLRKIILSFRPDAIISFGSEINMYAILAKGSYSCPIIVSERNDPNISPKSTLIRKVRNVLYRNVDHIVFQTPEARRYFNNIPEERCSVIGNPVSDGLPYHTPILDRPFIFSAGRLNKQKNFPLLIKAFLTFHNSFVDYQLVIAGEGPENEQLSNLINSLNLSDNVKLIGFTKDVHRYMKECSMFVLSSNHEGISNVMLEALAIGVPTVCTDCPIGGARMIINDRHNGLLVPVNDENSLIDAMKYIASNPEFANAIGKEGRKIREIYSVDKVTKKWDILLNRYLGVENENLYRK